MKLSTESLSLRSWIVKQGKNCQLKSKTGRLIKQSYGSPLKFRIVYKSGGAKKKKKETKGEVARIVCKQPDIAMDCVQD